MFSVDEFRFNNSRDVFPKINSCHFNSFYFKIIGRLSYESYWRSVVLEYLYNFRLKLTDSSLPKSSLEFSLRRMSMDTGVCVQDIASTMQSLNLFVLINNPTAKTDKNKKVLFVDLNSNLIDQHMKKLNEIPLEKRMALKLDKMCLIWTPYISYHLMAAANQAQDSLKFVDAETQTISNISELNKSKTKQQTMACYDEEFSHIKELSELSKYDSSKESLKVINLLALKESGRKRGRKRKIVQNNDGDEEEFDECSQDVNESECTNQNNGVSDSMIAVATDSILNYTEFNDTKNETLAAIGDESDSNHMDEDLAKARRSSVKKFKNRPIKAKNNTITRLDEENEDDLLEIESKPKEIDVEKSALNNGKDMSSVKPVNKNTRRMSISDIGSKQHSTPLITSMMPSSSSMSTFNKLNLTPSTTAKKQSQKSSKLNKSGGDTNENGMKQTKLDAFMKKKEVAEIKAHQDKNVLVGTVKKKKLFVNNSDEEVDDRDEETIITRPTPEQQRDKISNQEVLQSDIEIPQKNFEEQQQSGDINATEIDCKSSLSSRSSSPVSYTAPLSPKKINSIPDFDEDDEDSKDKEKTNDNIVEFVEPKPLPVVTTCNQDDNNNISDVNMSISSTKAELSSYMEEATTIDVALNNGVISKGDNQNDSEGKGWDFYLKLILILKQIQLESEATNLV